MNLRRVCKVTFLSVITIIKIEFLRIIYSICNGVNECLVLNGVSQYYRTLHFVYTLEDLKWDKTH